MLSNAWKIAIILITISLISGSITANSTSVNEIFIIISPGITWEEASYVASNLNLSDYSIAKIHPKPPYDYDLFLYQLMTADKNYYYKIPVNESFALVKGKSLTWYSIINQSQLISLWNNISLLNILMVDPVNHSEAFNPIYNISDKIIPPCIITGKINETNEWDILNTTFTLTLQEDLLKITLNAYNVTLSVNLTTRVSSEAKINVNDTDVLKGGVYYVKFYVIDMNETHATIFFPGTLSSFGWQSPVLGEFTGILPFWFMYDERVMSQLTSDALKWWVNESIVAFEKTVVTALYRTGVDIQLLYYPYYRFASRLESRVNTSEITRMVSESLSRIVSEYMARKPGSTIIIMNPFQIIGNPSLNVPGDRLARGLFNVTGRLNDLYAILAQESNLNFTLTNIGGETFLMINTPEVEGVGDGIVLFTPGNAINLASMVGLETSDLQNYIFMLTKGFNPNIGSLIDLLSDKEKTIGELNTSITELNLRINELNTSLANMQLRFSECQSINANLSSRILSVEDEFKKAEEFRNQAYAFITIGYLGLIMIAVGLTLIASRTSSLKQKA